MAINYAARLERAREKMDELGIELLYVPQSSNLQWLTGIPREKPSYTYVQYPGGWLNGAFIGLTKGPILAVPRMAVEFDIGHLPHIDTMILPDSGDASELAKMVLGEFRAHREKSCVRRAGVGKFDTEFASIVAECGIRSGDGCVPAA